MACPVCGRDYLTLALDEENCCPGPAPEPGPVPKVCGHAGRPRTPERTEAVLALRAQGLLTREIADRLGVAEGTVSSRIARARDRGQVVAPRRRGPEPHPRVVRELQGAGR